MPAPHAGASCAPRASARSRFERMMAPSPSLTALSAFGTPRPPIPYNLGARKGFDGTMSVMSALPHLYYVLEALTRRRWALWLLLAAGCGLRTPLNQAGTNSSANAGGATSKGGVGGQGEGGTSAGAPEWAAIAALGSGANNANFYSDKASADNSSYFTDISSGTNGDCGYVCAARKNYDYVTGLGTPRTVVF